MDKTINIFANLGPSLVKVELLLTACAYLIGIALILRGVMALKHAGEQKSHMSQQHSLKEPMMLFFAGAMLMYFPTGLHVVLQTVFGSENILSYDSLSTGNQMMASIKMFGDNLFLFVQVIGLVSFIRGWILIAKSASQSGHQQGSFAKGIMHIIGGTLAINIVETLNVINNTLYG